MAQTLNAGTRRLDDPIDTDIKFTPVEIDGLHYQYWQEAGRWYIRRHGEASACAGPARTMEALNRWIKNPDREYKEYPNDQRKGLPMTDDRKPINVRTFVTAIRTCNATAERICGITYSVVGDKHILRENGDVGFTIEDWERFKEDDAYAQETVNEFLRQNNELRTRNHHSRPASQPPELGRVVNKSKPAPRRDYSSCRGYEFPLAGYYAVGMREAARRSRSAPGWLRWETIKAKPAPPLTVIHCEDAVSKLAEQKRQPESLAAAATLKMSDFDAPQTDAGKRFAAAHRPQVQPATDPDDYPMTPDAIIASAAGTFVDELTNVKKGQYGYADGQRKNQLSLGHGLFVHTETSARGETGLYVYHEDNAGYSELIGCLTDAGKWVPIVVQGHTRWAIRKVVEAAGIGDPDAVMDDGLDEFVRIVGGGSDDKPPFPQRQRPAA